MSESQARLGKSELGWRAAFWVLRAIYLGVAVACFVRPDFDSNPFSLTWTIYALGVGAAGAFLATFRGARGANLAFVGIYLAANHLGILCFVDPDTVLAELPWGQSTSSTRDPGRGDVYFTGVILLAIANGIVVNLLWGLVWGSPGSRRASQDD